MTNHSFLPYVSKPGRYLGNEFNAIKKDWNSAEARFALVFPDLYEIGMSHFGLQILYHILNREERVLAERCFTPDLDAEHVLREKQQPLRSLENSEPLASFDVLGITLPYELCYTNILTVLDLAGIPFSSSERQENQPIVLGGGSCSLNPEPVARFFDAILLGDGEEAIVEIANIVKQGRHEGWKKSRILTEMSEVEGIYIPAHFTPEYDDRKRLTTIKAEESKNKDSIVRRIVSDLSEISHLRRPIVPHAKIVHDRLGIEIARGCTRGCRFCQAGMIYRPVRERTVDQILELAREGIEASGFEELALLSLSTGDHSCINEILPRLMDRFAADYVSVSMPSMRVGTLSPAVMDQIKRVRKTGFTLAPEAGSERLRQVINKGITEADLLTTCEDAFSLGWNTIKLYFMIGLPTETMEDIDAIADLAKKVVACGSRAGGRRRQVTVSIGTFVPKPHTPFQWEEQLSLERSRERIQYLKKILPRKGVNLKWHDPETSFLEGVFSRGDRQLAGLVETAWSLGARLDGWSDHFDFSLWEEAAERCDIDLPAYLRAREQDEVLPWQHLLSGIDTSYLREEMENAIACNYTPDCRYHGCQKCGLCDFNTIQPIVHNQTPVTSGETVAARQVQKPHLTESHFKYFAAYSRSGDISYLGHLEILQLVFRSLRRAGIRTNFSKGFNPSPKISFGPALPVGMESEAEFFIMDLPTPLDDPEKARKILNENLPAGLDITALDLHSGKIPQGIINFYSVTLPRNLSGKERENIQRYLASSSFLLKRVRKGKEKELDIRPLVNDITIIDETTIELQLTATAGTPGVKAEEALRHILGLQEQEVKACRLKKTSWKGVDNK